MICCPVKYLLWTIASEKKDRRLRGLVSLVNCFRSKTQGSSAMSTLPCFGATYFMKATSEKQNIVQLYLQEFSTKSHLKTITVNLYSCFVEVRLNGDDEISVNSHVGCRRITNELLTVLSDRPSEPYTLQGQEWPSLCLCCFVAHSTVTLLCIELKENPSKTCSGKFYIWRGSKLSLFLSNTYEYGNKSMQLVVQTFHI